MEGSKAEMTTAAEALGQALDQLQSALDGGQDVLTEGAATLRAWSRSTRQRKRQNKTPKLPAASICVLSGTMW